MKNIINGGILFGMLIAMGFSGVTWSATFVVDDKYYEEVETEVTNYVQHTFGWAVGKAHQQSGISHTIDFAYVWVAGQTTEISSVTFTSAVKLTKSPLSGDVHLSGQIRFEKDGVNGIEKLPVGGTVQVKGTTNNLGVFRDCVFRGGSIQADNNVIGIYNCRFYGGSVQGARDGTFEGNYFSNTYVHASKAVVMANTFYNPNVSLTNGDWYSSNTNLGETATFALGGDFLILKELPMSVNLTLHNLDGGSIRDLTLSKLQGAGSNILFQRCHLVNRESENWLRGDGNTFDSCQVYSNAYSYGLSLFGDSNAVRKSYFGIRPWGEYDTPKALGGANLYVDGRGNQIGGLSYGAGTNIIFGQVYIRGEGNRLEGNIFGEAVGKWDTVAPGAGPIDVRGSEHFVTGNRLVNTRVDLINASSVTVSSNFHLRGLHSIWARNSINCVIYGNTLIQIQLDTIRAESCPGIRISGNNIGYHNQFPYGTSTNEGAAGIYLTDCPNAVIGGNRNWGEGNIIVRCHGPGIFLTAANLLGDHANRGTEIRGNTIGCLDDMNYMTSNSWSGILLYRSAEVTIGGTNAGDCNVIGNNGEYGIQAGDSRLCNSPYMYCDDIYIYGNHIGAMLVDDVWSNVGNAKSGIFFAGCQNPARFIIGAESEAMRNTIGWNKRHGVEIYWGGHSNKTSYIWGNYVGYSPVNRQVMGNGGDGMWIAGVTNLEIGSDWHTNNLAGGEFFGNIVSGNASNGLYLGGGRSVKIAGNLLGVDEKGSNAVPNGGNGLFISYGRDVVVGDYHGQSSFSVASGNRGHGIEVRNSQEIHLTRNFVGTGMHGQGNIPNASNGIYMAYCDHCYIGWPFEDVVNYIGGNGGYGIQLTRYCSDISIYQNYIGRGPDGMTYGINSNAAIAIHGDNPGAMVSNQIGGVEGAVPQNFLDGIVGIEISNAVYQIVENNYIGFHPGGTWQSDSLQTGIAATRAYKSLIGDRSGNFIGACRAAGIRLTMTNTVDNTFVQYDLSSGATLRGNLIGCATNLSGFVTNAGAGIVGVSLGHDRIGDPAKPNWIAHCSTGIVIQGARKLENNFGQLVVAGNRVGLIPGATAVPGNRVDGLVLEDCADLAIGPSGPGETDIFSGNGGHGIRLDQCRAVSVRQALAGVTADGITAAPNTLSGLYALNCTGLTVGVSGVAPNVLSGNGQNGARIWGGVSNRLVNNLIGLVTNGATVPNRSHGVFVAEARQTVVGGTTAELRNVISGNASNGIVFQGNANGDPVGIISGNLIGTDLAGTGMRGNGRNGILVANSASNNIGGWSPAEGNRIVGNGENGVLIAGERSAGNLVSGNEIGMASNTALANAGHGVCVTNAPRTIIGVARDLSANRIGGNGGAGIVVAGAAAGDAAIRGNAIGLAGNGVAALPNAGGGIRVAGAPGVAIGGAFLNQGNHVAGNQGNGILLDEAQTAELMNNRVGVLWDGSAALANEGCGVLLSNASECVIGPDNIIGGNGGDGIHLAGPSADNNDIVSNRIGTLELDGLDLGNQGSGISLRGGDRNEIGSCNIIARNYGRGVAIYSGARNTVMGNHIYMNGWESIHVATNGTPGPNMGIRTPIVTNVFAGSTHVQGLILGQPMSPYVLEAFYSWGTNDLGGFAQYPLNQRTNYIAFAGPGGVGAFNLVWERTAPVGSYVVVSATDTNFNTSQYSWPVQVGPAPDTYNYGVPDFYYEDVYTNLSYSQAGQAYTNDYDGDGLSDRDEWIAGTDPEDPDSNLRVDLGSLNVPCTDPGRLYEVEYSADLPEQVWTPYASALGTGSNLVFDVDYSAGLADAAAYRVKALGP